MERNDTKWECHGPCHQGRAPCPTPEACERPEDESTFRLLGQAFLAVALAVALVVLVSMAKCCWEP